MMTMNSVVGKAVRVQYEGIDDEILGLPTALWCWTERNGKLTKPPISPATFGYAKVNDPATWGTFDQAFALYQVDTSFDGIGVLLTEDDPYCILDLDNCIRDDGSIAAWAKELLTTFAGYNEFTPSGRGLRIWIRGTKPTMRCVRQMPDGGKLEIYDRSRFVTVTGHRIECW